MQWQKFQPRKNGTLKLEIWKIHTFLWKNCNFPRKLTFWTKKTMEVFFVQTMFLFKKRWFLCSMHVNFQGCNFQLQNLRFRGFSKLHHDTCFSPPMTLKVGSLAKVDVFWVVSTLRNLKSRHSKKATKEYNGKGKNYIPGFFGVLLPFF